MGPDDLPSLDAESATRTPAPLAERERSAGAIGSPSDGRQVVGVLDGARRRLAGVGARLASVLVDLADDARVVTQRLSSPVRAAVWSLTRERRRAQEERERRAEAQAHVRLNDPVENAKTRLPPGESISMPAIWLAEAYPPSHIASLRQGLRRLEHPEHGQVILDDPGKWIDGGRRYASGWFYASLGLIRRPNVRSARVMFDSTNRLAPDLPEGVDYAHGSLVSLIPGTVVLVMQFVLEEPVARMLETPLRRDFATTLEPTDGGGSRYHMPGDRREAAVEALRTELRQRCAAWFAANAPGAFCALSPQRVLPSCEFLVTEVATPFPESRGSPSTYLEPLDLNRWFDTAISTEWPGVRLGLPFGRDSEPQRLVLAGRREELFAGDDLTSYGGRDDWALANRLSKFDRTVALWTLYCLTSTYETELMRLRDAIGAVGLRDAVSISRDVREVEQRLASLRRDLVSFVREFGQLTKTAETFTYGIVEFGPLTPARPGEPPFLEALRREVRRRLRALRDVEAELTRLADGLSALASALSSERLAGSNIRLQWAAILISVISTAIALAALLSGR